MRIAHLPSMFFPSIGGAEISTFNISRQQQEAGHFVRLIVGSFRSPGEWRRWRRVVPVPMLPLVPKSVSILKRLEKLPLGHLWFLRTQLSFYQSIHRFDVWHINLIAPIGLYAVEVLKQMGVPVVGTCRGIDIQKMPEIGYGYRLDPAMERRIRRALDQFDMLTALSESVRSEYLHLGVEPAKIQLVPNGINARYIQSWEVDRKKVRKQLGWPLDRPIVLTVGRNHPKKGYRHIPDILGKVIEKRPDVLWVIVGKGAEPIGEEAGRRGLGDQLMVLPEIGLEREGHEDDLLFPTDDLVRLYKAADVFAFPTLLETFGNVQMEAMAAGLPVVTTDAPGARDVVKDGVTGLASPVGDTGGMAKNILRVLDDSGLARRLIRNGLENSRAYEWDDVAEQYCRVYQAAAEKRQVADS